MLNPKFKNFSLHNQEISAKRTLNLIKRVATFGHERTLGVNEIVMNMNYSAHWSNIPS